MKIKYTIHDEENTDEYESYGYESCGSDFQILTRNQQSALCKKKKRKRNKRRKLDEERLAYQRFCAHFENRKWCENCTHHVLTEMLVMCALHPVTIEILHSKGYLKPNQESPNAVHWLVKYPFYGELLLAAGFEIISTPHNTKRLLLDADKWDSLKWENTAENRQKVRSAFAKFRLKFKNSPWKGRCINYKNKRCTEHKGRCYINKRYCNIHHIRWPISNQSGKYSKLISGNINNDLKIKKRLISTFNLWKLAAETSKIHGSEIKNIYDGISRAHFSKILNSQNQEYIAYHYSSDI